MKAYTFDRDAEHAVIAVVSENDQPDSFDLLGLCTAVGPAESHNAGRLALDCGAVAVMLFRRAEAMGWELVWAKAQPEYSAALLGLGTYILESPLLRKEILLAVRVGRFDRNVTMGEKCRDN